MSGPLGRRPPTDWVHVERFPLMAAPVTPSPVILGINWYSVFDSPVLRSDGRYWIADGNLGHIRGGHCLCVKDSAHPDLIGWWEFYDQGQEGACVGFGCSRAMSLLNRTRYDGQWLYHTAQENDEWPGEDYDGTSVRAGLDVLRAVGAKRSRSGLVLAGDGISEYRWATSVEMVHASIQSPLADTLEAVPLLNSWGKNGYPHITWMPDTVLERVLAEDGEAGLITDR